MTSQRAELCGAASNRKQEASSDEGKTVSKTDMREMQGYKTQGQGHGDLRVSQAQAGAGLTIGGARDKRGDAGRELADSGDFYEALMERHMKMIIAEVVVWHE
jgi:hypothetical protein